MIQLFIAFPAVNNDAEDLELVYLKSISSPDSKTVEDILKKAIKAVSITKFEKRSVLYDNNRLSQLLNIVKKSQEGEKGKESPGLGLLRRSMSEWNDLNKKKDSFKIIKVSDVEQKQGVLCALINLKQSNNDVTVDVDAINGFSGLRIIDNKGASVNVNKVDAKEGEVYKWFADHREPHREIDAAYKKHSTKEKKTKKGVISANKLPVKDSEKMLQWAVGPENSNRMYFHDVDEGVIVVFWKEDGSKGKQFHTYEVSEDNKDEISKILDYKDGTELYKIIGKIAKYYPDGKNE